MLEVKLQGQSGTTGTNRPSSCLRVETSQTSVRNQRGDWETGGADVFTGSNRFKTKEILRIGQETQRLMPASICESLMKVQIKSKPTRTKETENRTHVRVLKAPDWPGG